MTPRTLRRALGAFIIGGGAFVVICAHLPVEGLLGFVLAAIGCALMVGD